MTNEALTTSEVCELIGCSNDKALYRMRNKQGFPEPIFSLRYKTKCGRTPIVNHYNKNEVFLWCEERYNHIISKLEKQILSYGYGVRSSKLVKKQYKYLTSKPFSSMEWKGQLIYGKPSTWIANQLPDGYEADVNPKNILSQK